MKKEIPVLSFKSGYTALSRRVGSIDFDNSSTRQLLQVTFYLICMPKGDSPKTENCVYVKRAAVD